MKSCRQNKFAICQISIIWSGIKSQHQVLHDLIALKRNKTKITQKDQKLRFAAELNSSDSIHSESSIDELNFLTTDTFNSFQEVCCAIDAM